MADSNNRNGQRPPARQKPAGKPNKSPASAPSADDKTRVAGSERVKAAEQKTRVAGRRPAAPGADKTRVARRPASDEKTRVAARAQPEDKTQIARRGTNAGAKPRSSDATRVAGDRAARPASASDRTRVAKPGTAAASQPAGDATTFRAPPKKAGAGAPSRAAGNGGAGDGKDTTAGGKPPLKNRFVLEKILGAGGMGVVYKAKDLLKVEAQDRDPYLAVKVLGEEFKSHPEAFIALQRESRKTQRIAHPNIVNVHDFDRDGDAVFMTMEYMEGESLDKVIRRYKSTGLPTDDVWRILDGICAALKHAHLHNIIHSDFKPGNVFLTENGTAKVFDFGIARAVAQAQTLESSEEDHTVFDAGSLGALTPAYASLEMLEGLAPDVSDDVYALGCVAYELFTGDHPYNKLPADEAQRLKLKPKRIPGITKRQWRVIEKALAFRREDRIATVDEFWKGLTNRYSIVNKVAVVALVLALSSVIAFLALRPQPQQQPEVNLSEVERQLRIDLAQETLEKLLADPTFSAGWREQVLDAVTTLRQLMPADAPWLVEHVARVYQLYLEQIIQAREERAYELAEKLIAAARPYTDDASELERQSELLAQALAAEEKARQQLAAQKARESQQKVSAQKQRAADKKAFDVALGNVKDQLQCDGSLNMRSMATAVEKLRSIDMRQYRRLEPDIVRSLASCLVDIGRAFPARAEEAKKYALRLFDNHTLIAAVEIVPRDPCDISLAGKGARGARGGCRDRLGEWGNGPEMVVVPAASGMDAFAIGRYEVAVRDYNKFCKVTGQCQARADNETMPVTGIAIDDVQNYLRWLTQTTDRKYRLPSVKEWQYAARAGTARVDANRNCKLSSRGIEKGGSLLVVSAGRANPWGLVNPVGNAQELAYGRGKRLMAMGGSFRDPIEECTTSTRVEHDGGADQTTGFRLLRELRQ